MGGCGGHERTDFYEFLYWEDVAVLNLFTTVSTLGGCGALERTDFSQFLLWDGVLVSEELIFNSFYFGRKWWS